MRTLIRFIILLVMTASASPTLAGNLDNAGAPADGSGMPTTSEIYNRLDTGAAIAAPGAFMEPETGPSGGSGRTLAEIGVKLPAPDNTSGAAVGDVLSGKTFWGLRTDGTWGLKTGTSITPAVGANVTGTNGLLSIAIPDALYSGGKTATAVDAALVTGNIRSGVTVFGVSGNPAVVNTSSATAVAGDMRSGKTAYVNGALVTGTSHIASIVCQPGWTGSNCDIADSPQISLISPSDGQFGVLEDGTLTITFSIAMNPATLTFKTVLDVNACSGSIQLSTDNFASCIPLSGKVMSNGDKTVTLTPAPGWSFGSTFKTRVTTAVQGANAMPLAAAVTQASGFTTRLSPASSGVVISEVYASGGSTIVSTYLNDYVVLHNRGASAVDVSNWSVQYQADNSSTWAVNMLPAAQSIAAGGYYLIKLASGGAVGAALPTADATPATGSNLDPSKGKLALVAGAAPLANGCPAPGTVVDLVGYGANTQPCNEGAGPGPAQADATKSLQRKQAGCSDADNNSRDFISASADPRNSTGLTNVCRSTHNEAGDGFEFDYCASLTPGVSVSAGANMVLTGEVYESSLTPGAGASPRNTAQVGYGPRSTNPEWQNAGWIFVPATYVGDAGNNDQYSTTVMAPVAGEYSYVYRFSMDGGFTWTYCDQGGAGSNPGLQFETTRLPVVHVN